MGAKKEATGAECCSYYLTEFSVEGTKYRIFTSTELISLLAKAKQDRGRDEDTREVRLRLMQKLQCRSK